MDYTDSEQGQYEMLKFQHEEEERIETACQLTQVGKPDKFPRDGLLAARQRFIELFSTHDHDIALFFTGIALCNAVIWYEDNAGNGGAA